MQGAPAVNKPAANAKAISIIGHPFPVWSAYTRPGNRVVTSWISQPLPSGSLNETNEP